MSAAFRYDSSVARFQSMIHLPRDWQNGGYRCLVPLLRGAIPGSVPKRSPVLG